MLSSGFLTTNHKQIRAIIITFFVKCTEAERKGIASHSCINRTFNNNNNNNLTLAFLCSIFIDNSRNYLQRASAILCNKSELWNAKCKIYNRVLNQFQHFSSHFLFTIQPTVCFPVASSLHSTFPYRFKASFGWLA